MNQVDRVKVAHIATVDLSLRYLLLNQMLYLQHAGCDVMGISAPGPHVPAIEAAGIPHIPISITRRMTPLRDLRTLAQLVRVLRRERFTIVHTHTPKPGLIGQLAAKITRTPIVLNTLHGFYFHEHMRPITKNFYAGMERVAALCSDAILSQNKEDMHTAVELGICPADLVHWLGNGIDIDRFDRRQLKPAMLEEKRRQLGIPPGKRVIGFVGRLVEEKGLLELFSAMQRISQGFSDVVLLLIGPLDKEKADVLSLESAATFGIADKCIFTGFRDDMPDLYALMDIFVLPSHREGFPRSTMEASAMGVPCVATDIRGCREAVVDGRNGLLVPLKDANALADALTKLLMDKRLTAKLGENGRTVAVEQFDEQIVFERVRVHYERLLLAKQLHTGMERRSGIPISR